MKRYARATVAFVLVVTAISHGETTIFSNGDRTFEMEFVKVGDTGNIADMAVTNLSPSQIETTRQHNGVMPVGSVDYPYHIGRYEVSISEIELAIESGVTAIHLDTDEIRQRISEPTPDMPALGISWIEAAHYTNWLNEIAGFPHAYKFEPFENPPLQGDFFRWSRWGIGDAGFNPENPIRNSLSKFVIPNAHEWHKAAYYDPDSQSYLNYSTGDQLPQPTLNGSEADTAVFGFEFVDGPADVNDAGGVSPYGAMAMTGNVLEWEEGAYDVDNVSLAALNGYRVTRGGSWAGAERWLPSSVRSRSESAVASLQQGLRVAMVEPRTILVGDFNRDGEIDGNDIDLLATRSREDALIEFDVHREARPFDLSNNILDLNNDNFLNDVDRQLWLTHVADTTTGDSDLDGDVDFEDFLSLANNFGMSPSSWSQGDYDGNNETNFLDFLALADNFTNASVPHLVPVPEPSSALLALLLVVPLFLSRWRRGA